MALIDGNILEVTALQELDGNPLLNIFQYRYDEGDTAATYNDLADLFGSQWAVDISAHLSTAHELVGVRIVNLTNGVDEYAEAKAIVGDITGERLADVYAASFQLVRGSRITRHGYKRFAGIPEASVSANALTDTGAIDDINRFLLGTNLAVDVGMDENYRLTPVIVGRELTTVGDKEYYVYDLSRVNSISSTRFVKMSTQRTRFPN